MEDLFEREQNILDHALAQLGKIEQGGCCSPQDYGVIVEEYRKLLKQLRRITKISDKTTEDLNTSKLALLGKVHYDQMTGIYNRRFLDENFKRILGSLRRSGETLSVLMVDVDFFKRYNDTYGHSVGDDCLRAVAKALTASIFRSGDFVARYGGEEFLVICCDTDANGARVTAQRILESVRACQIPHEKSDAAGYVTVSVGATTGAVTHYTDPEDYIKTADKAMYASKQNGRNQSTFIAMGGIIDDV